MNIVHRILEVEILLEKTAKELDELAPRYYDKKIIHPEDHTEFLRLVDVYVDYTTELNLLRKTFKLQSHPDGFREILNSNEDDETKLFKLVKFIYEL